jgi:hypothetical protein
MPAYSSHCRLHCKTRALEMPPTFSDSLQTVSTKKMKTKPQATGPASPPHAGTFCDRALGKLPTSSLRSRSQWKSLSPTPTRLNIPSRAGHSYHAARDAPSGQHTSPNQRAHITSRDIVTSPRPGEVCSQRCTQRALGSQTPRSQMQCSH